MTFKYLKNYILSTGFLLVGSIGLSAQDMKPEDTEVWEPEPTVVKALSHSSAPSDALVLFDGTNLSHWTNASGNPPEWGIEGDAMTIIPGTGALKTRENFGSIQLHIEWRTPAVVKGEGQGRGNSGIFFQGMYELQVLDSYNNRTYSNGQAGSIYKQTAPLVNASKGPGEWQTYDVIYMAPVFNEDGTYKKYPTITVFHNGVLIQNHTVIRGTTPYIGPPKVVKHSDGPIILQDHDNPTSYRNIWVRKL